MVTRVMGMAHKPCPTINIEKQKNVTIVHSRIQIYVFFFFLTDK